MLWANVWKWWRNAPGFSQRFTGIISDDVGKIVGKGAIVEGWSILGEGSRANLYEGPADELKVIRSAAEQPAAADQASAGDGASQFISVFCGLVLDQRALRPAVGGGNVKYLLS
jgi:hypothetical protein